jgi:hypothetical protein
LFRGDQLVLVARYSGRGDSDLLEGTVNGATRKFTYEVSFPLGRRPRIHPASGPRDESVTCWTKSVCTAKNAELRDEVTELARKYGIVTPYTAYLIVEDEDRRRVPLTMHRCRNSTRIHCPARGRAKTGGLQDERTARRPRWRAYGLALKMAEARPLRPRRRSQSQPRVGRHHAAGRACAG